MNKMGRARRCVEGSGCGALLDEIVRSFPVRVRVSRALGHMGFHAHKRELIKRVGEMLVMVCAVRVCETRQLDQISGRTR